jgi:hypothetical protein
MNIQIFKRKEKKPQTTDTARLVHPEAADRTDHPLISSVDSPRASWSCPLSVLWPYNVLCLRLESLETELEEGIV